MKVVGHIYLYRERSELGDCNTYYIDGKCPVLVDPGNPRFIRSKMAEMEEDGVDLKKVKWVVNTHTHPDHSAANKFIVELTGARIWVHPLEFKTFEFNRKIAQFLGIEFPTFESTSEFPKLEGMRIVHTPGHTAGSICLYLPKFKALLSGDLIFRGGVGRTDLPGGSMEELEKSLVMISQLELLYLLPGHGEILGGKDEVARNFEMIRKRMKF